jgi:hypothetical protein
MTGSLVLDRHGVRDEHRDDQAPKVSEAFSAERNRLKASNGINGRGPP